MDRQPRGVIAALILFAAGCDEDSQGRHSFDGPGASDWLEAGQGPFDEAVAFVANTRGGTIVPIDLKHATLLSDLLGSPFLVESPVVGSTRMTSAP